MSDDGYSLDLLSPVRHVATELDGAASAVLSVSEMAATYRHPNTGDLARVKREQGYVSNEDANGWFMARAIEELGGQVEPDDDGNYRLTRPFDKLRYPGQHKLHRDHDPHAQLRAPFDPMTGRFSENVRRNTGKDGMEELRESMRSFGWVEEFPAIQDERGVVLVGHRRLAVAKELGIEPVVKTVRLGDGDEADARRFRIAIVSNLASKPFTPEERKDLAEYLSGERNWSIRAIAAALKVSKSTIANDLMSNDWTKDQQAKKDSTKQKDKPKATPKPPVKATPDLESRVRALVDAGEPVPRGELATEFGVGQNTVQLAHQRAIGRREERERLAAPATPAGEHEHRYVCETCGEPFQSL